MAKSILKEVITAGFLKIVNDLNETGFVTVTDLNGKVVCKIPPEYNKNNKLNEVKSINKANAIINLFEGDFIAYNNSGNELSSYFNQNLIFN